MELIYNSSKGGGDSNVYKQGDACIKEFPSLTKYQVDIYLSMLYKLNGVELKFKLENIYELGNLKISNIKVNFANTNSESYIEGGKVFTKSKFIEGKTLADVYGHYSNQKTWSTIMLIIKLITNYITKEYGINMKETVFVNQIHELNIKAIGYEKGELTLTVTDIACTISEFLKNNSKRIESII